MSKLTPAPSFADALAAVAEQAEPKCRVHHVLKRLNPEDRAAVVRALAMPQDELAHTDIAAACKLIGHHLSRDSIGRHRNHKCACS